MIQKELFSLDNPVTRPSGEILRDKGIKQAVDHAEEVSDGWHEKALRFLESYCQTHQFFSGEMVRMAAVDIPTPPCLRTWGGVMVAGAKRGWIKQIGTEQVTNPKAHRANAARWESLIYRG